MHPANEPCTSLRAVRLTSEYPFFEDGHVVSLHLGAAFAAGMGSVSPYVGRLSERPTNGAEMFPVPVIPGEK